MADEIVKPQVKVVVKSEDENLPEFKIEAAKEDFSKRDAKLDESQDLAPWWRFCLERYITGENDDKESSKEPKTKNIFIKKTYRRQKYLWQMEW